MPSLNPEDPADVERAYDAFNRHASMNDESRRVLRDVVNDLDAEWFRDHPAARERYREYIPGEFDSEGGVSFGDPTDTIVRVCPGGREMLDWNPIGPASA